jgi:hypothetical protein
MVSGCTCLTADRLVETCFEMRCQLSAFDIPKLRDQADIYYLIVLYAWAGSWLLITERNARDWP